MLVNLVNAVNKLMVQHAVDVTNLQNNIKQLENKIITNQEGEIIKKLEKKIAELKSLQQKHSDDIERVKKTHSEDMKKLQGFLFLFAEKFKLTYLNNHQTRTPQSPYNWPLFRHITSTATLICIVNI